MSLLLLAWGALATPTGPVPGPAGPGPAGPAGPATGPASGPAAGPAASPNPPASPPLPFRPPPPPASPPSSPPSLPPPQPPGLCLDTCNEVLPEQGQSAGPAAGPAPAPSGPGRRLQQGSGKAGVCEDGLGTASGICAYGSDCSDCGHRAICSSCPEECAAQLADAVYCLEAMWQDEKTCYDACNTRVCEHRGCSIQQAAAACTPLQRATLSELVKVPAFFDVDTLTTTASAAASATTPVEMVVSFSSFDLYRGESTLSNRMLASVTMTTTFLWRDSRVATSPCGFMLPSMLEITSTSNAQTKADADAATELLWLPLLTISQSQTVETTSQSFVAADALNWTLASYDNSSQCDKCLNYTVSLDVTWLLDRADWTWGDYPFDSHVLRMVLQVPGANLYTCEQAVRQVLDGEESSLLPSTNEWGFDSDFATPVVSVHPTHGGSADVTQCEVRVYLTRAYFVFLIKTVVVGVLVVYSGLAGLILDGRDHTGDRTAIILVSALIVTTSFQTDLGLGTLHYLIWWDYFNVMQMMVLLTAMIFVLWEHRLIISEQEALADHVNKVTRVSMLVGVYPLCLTAFFLYGFGHSTLMILLLATGLPAIAALSYLAIRRRLRLDETRRANAVQKLRDYPVSHPDFKKLLRAAYKVIDQDNSGTVSLEEIRTLTSAIFPSLTPKESLNLTTVMRNFADGVGQDSISVDALYEGVLYLSQELADSPNALKSARAEVGQSDFSEGERGQLELDKSGGIWARKIAERKASIRPKAHIHPAA